MRVFVALAVFRGCPRPWLGDVEAMRGVLRAAVDAGSFTLFDEIVRGFEPEGVTACAVLGESHVALHSWPLEGRLFVDVASCGAEEGVTHAIEAVARLLPAGELAVLDRRVVTDES
jgi:S-adenosylmethionine decarboxylase